MGGFTEISTFNISTEECLDENIKENENNDDEKTELNEDLCLKDVVTEGESLGFIAKDELVEKEWLFNGDMIGLEEGKVCSTNTDNMSLSEDEDNEDNDFYRRYFGSSLSFPRQHMFTKDC